MLYFVCCISDTAVAAKQNMGHKPGIFMGISEVAEPDITDARLLVAAQEFIPCCHLERGNREALKMLVSCADLCALGVELARAVESSECFTELRKA